MFIFTSYDERLAEITFQQHCCNNWYSDMPNPMRQKAIEGLKAGDSFTYSRIFKKEETEKFGDMTRDYNPVHYDLRWAKSKGFDRLICHGLLVGSMICEFGGQVGWLATGMSYKFIKPSYFDEKIICTVTITKIEKSGKAEAEALFFNASGEKVCCCLLTGRLPQLHERILLARMITEGDPTNKLNNVEPENQMKYRCEWCGSDPLYVAYHDNEWGVPVHDDRRLFEKLVLEGAQAGLSWLTILRKRENYRRAFHGFDPKRIAAYSDADIQRLLQDVGIVRNRLKIESAIQNARRVLEIKQEHGSFSSFLWRYVDNVPRQNAWTSMSYLPTRSEQSDMISKDLKKLGFKFVGSTICYALMQSVGLVNDHVVGCFRYAEVKEMA